MPAHEAGRYGEVEQRLDARMSTTLFINGEGQSVVVKGVAEDDNPVLKDRLAIEAKILAALDHPQIPALIADHTDEDAPYLVMRREPGVPSHSMAITFGGSQIPAKIVRSVLDPLAYVHDREFVHRDITTSNIVAQATGRASLIDFGASSTRPYDPLIESGELVEGSQEHARRRDRALRFSTPLTAGKIIVSAEYMSPEQYETTKVDITSDIYSLGITAYELFYGKLPFEIEERVVDRASAGPEDTAYDSVMPPSERRIHEFARRHREEEIDFTASEGREIPGEVIDFIERATQKDPADRYQSAKEMQEDVEIALRAVA